MPRLLNASSIAPGTGSRIEQPTNRYALYVQDAWRVRPNLNVNFGLRYAIHNEALEIPTYYKDFQPRVGFSWDPWGDGKTAIRGGAGIFVGFLCGGNGIVVDLVCGGLLICRTGTARLPGVERGINGGLAT
jgi:hypothetical protein